MNVTAQKRMASEILKCGVHRVYMDPEHIDDVQMAITREDIRNLIKNGIIGKHYIEGISRVRANLLHQKKKEGQRRGIGSRKGKAGARIPEKRRWINNIRPLRRELRKLRDTKKIDTLTYRKLYLKAKGGTFNSVAILHRYIEENKLIRSA
jgi:large subunit ribosomal protein L19e